MIVPAAGPLIVFDAFPEAAIDPEVAADAHQVTSGAGVFVDIHHGWRDETHS